MGEEFVLYGDRVLCKSYYMELLEGGFNKGKILCCFLVLFNIFFFVSDFDDFDILILCIKYVVLFI